MQRSTSSVVLPSIQSILDDVARYEAINRYSPPHNFPNPIHPITNRTLPPPTSKIYRHPTSLQSSYQTLPRIPAYSQAIYTPVHLQYSYLRVPHDRLCHHDRGETIELWRDRSPDAFRPLTASASNSPETEDLSPVPYITPLVALPDPARSPRLEHPPPSIAAIVAPRVFADRFRAHAIDFQSEEAFRAHLVPPRPIDEPAIEHESLLALGLVQESPPSPSLSLSPSIGGSPRAAPDRLPFPLIRATPSASSSQKSLPTTQIMSSHNTGRKTTSDQAPRLTKKGKPYTRNRPPGFTLTPEEKLSRTAWYQWEKDAAMEAIKWYENENPTFVLSKSTDAERKLALPVIYDHIVENTAPNRWRRTYDGFLTWTANARKRPTLRRPAGWTDATTGESS